MEGVYNGVTLRKDELVLTSKYHLVVSGSRFGKSGTLA